MSRIAIASKKSIYPPLTIAKCEILFPQSVLYWGHDSFIKLYFVSPPHSWRSLNWKTPSATSPILLIISSSTCSGLSPKKSDPLSDRHFRKLLQNNIYVSSDRQMSGLKLYPRYLNWKCFYVVSHQSWVPHFFERKQKESFAISEHVRKKLLFLLPHSFIGFLWDTKYFYIASILSSILQGNMFTIECVTCTSSHPQFFFYFI